MNDGFDITFREVVPECGVVELVVAELDRVTPHPGLHCSVVVRRRQADPFPFDVHVELRGRKVAHLHADAVDLDQCLALRQAFAALRVVCASSPTAERSCSAGPELLRDLYSAG
jgi:hypothetical protein